MKLNQVTTNYNYGSPISATQNTHNPEYLRSSSSSKVAFKGGKDFAANTFDKLGANFFLQFLVVDTLSLVLPRIWVGLNRDKEKTGKYNTKAGLEEAGREILSGPSMGLIPLAVLTAATKINPAVHMEHNTLKALSDVMGKTVKDATSSNSNILSDKSNTNKALAGELFENSFKDFKLENTERKEFKKEFVRLLSEGTDAKLNILPSAEFKSKRSEFEELVVKINNKNKAVIPNDTKAIGISFFDKDIEKATKTSVSAKDLFTDFHNYSKDVVDKLIKKDFVKEGAKTASEKAAEFISGIQKSRSNQKLATVIAGFLAVGGFLLYLPKLYQQGNTSPAQESAKHLNCNKEGGSNEIK